jgi:nucleoid-associated protein YgaU
MKILKLGLSLSIALLVGISSSLVAKDVKITLPPSWIVTRFNYNVTVEELAHRYYGNSQDYIYILEANKKLLNGSHLVPKNVEIKIPITEKFRDQPEKLGWQ